MSRPGTGLTVKGTSIKGFDEETSVQKTLRKPEEQLKQFGNSGPKKVIELFDAIKTMGIKLNGRVNSEVILLRAVR
jgi:DNA-directed RNA polymerase alpha subunit